MYCAFIGHMIKKTLEGSITNLTYVLKQKNINILLYRKALYLQRN